MTREGHRMFADEVITDDCLAARGIEGAWEEACRRLRQHFMQSAEAWRGRGAEFGLTLSLKRPEERGDAQETA